jgi:hypothetical protein
MGVKPFRVFLGAVYRWTALRRPISIEAGMEAAILTMATSPGISPNSGPLPLHDPVQVGRQSGLARQDSARKRCKTLTFARVPWTLEPPQSHPKATYKPYTVEYRATLKPPQGYPKATPRLPQGYPKATLRLPQSHPKAWAWEPPVTAGLGP